LTLPGVQTPGAPRTSSINGLPKGSVNLTLDGANIQDNFLRSSDGFFTQTEAGGRRVERATVALDPDVVVVDAFMDLTTETQRHSFVFSLLRAVPLCLCG
jgi:hypothetical protein